MKKSVCFGNAIYKIERTTFFLVIVGLSLLFCFGCKKDGAKQEEAAKYYLRFKAGGVQYEFKDPEWGGVSLGEGKQFYDGVYPKPFYKCTIAARTGGDNDLDFWISIKSPEIVNTGSYQSNPDDDFRGIPSVEMQCTLPVKDLYVKSKLYSNMEESPLSAQVLIQELSIDEMKGTFSGTLKEAGGNTLISITNGTFFLKRTD